MLFAIGLINFRVFFMKIGWEYFEFQYVIYSIQWSQMEKYFWRDYVNFERTNTVCGPWSVNLEMYVKKIFWKFIFQNIIKAR